MPKLQLQLPCTIEDMCKLLKKKFPKQLKKRLQENEGRVFTDDVVVWFFCCYEAENCVESFRLKDWAWLFQEGVAPMKQRVEEILTGLWEDHLEEVNGKFKLRKGLSKDDLKCLEEIYKEFLGRIKEHFGKS